MEFRVNQIWNDPYFGEMKVVYVTDESVTFEFEDGRLLSIGIKDSGWEHVLVLVKDSEAELSDLEIVQKALAVQGQTLTMFNDGSSHIFKGEAGRAIFYTPAEVLKWAKQTVGE